MRNQFILDTNLCRNLLKILHTQKKECIDMPNLPAASSKHLSAIRNQEFAALFSGLITVDETLSKDK